MKPVYLVDIDGTLADISHRLHFIKQEPKDWTAFFKACLDDAPIPEVIETLQLLQQGGAEILLLSGRSEIIRDQTLWWLAKHRVPCHALYLRQEDDHREDEIVKGEFVDDLLTKRKREDIRAVFEDRRKVCDMYRARGFRVFHVADGNF
jgi:hypothetical protein